MFKVRVIPCLDVKDGRVVKGVNFVDLREQGVPLEEAAERSASDLAIPISRVGALTLRQTGLRAQT